MGVSEQGATLERWQALYDDKVALVQSPEAHQQALIALAETLYALGVIDASGFASLLEKSDSAYQWGVRAQIMNELNRGDF